MANFNVGGVAWLVRSIALLLAAAAPLVQAQEYPTRPLRVIIPSNPGGTPDFISRVLAQLLPPILGQPVLVENRPGGGGVPGTLEVRNSQPDGHSILCMNIGQWGIYPAMNPSAPFDPVRDFAPVAFLFGSTGFFVVRSSLPVRDLREFIALARAKPGMAYGSMGVGGQTHLAIEAFAAPLGLKFTHIPYKGSGAAVEATLRGDVEFTLSSLAATGPHMKSGALRALAVEAGKRTAIAPDVPTIAEAAGLPGFEFGGTAGWVVRAGTPQAVINKLSAAVIKVASSPEVVERAASLGIDMLPSGPERFAEIIRNDLKRMTEAVRITGVKAE